MQRRKHTTVSPLVIRFITGIFALFLITQSFAQPKTPEDFGFRHLQTLYKGDVVDILIKSKKGEEQKKKPLLLFCQGSLPIPLLITYKNDRLATMAKRPIVRYTHSAFRLLTGLATAAFIDW